MEKIIFNGQIIEIENDEQDSETCESETQKSPVDILIEGLSTATTIAEIRSIAKEILTAAEEADQ